MRFLESVRIALQAIGANRLRSALTTLGILIGVAAVIVLVAVGNGASVAVQSSIESLGTNLILVQPGSQTGAGGVRGGLGSATSLTIDDARALHDATLAPDVAAAAPSVNTRVTAVAGNQNWTPQTFTGTTPDYARIRTMDVVDGSLFSDADVTSRQRVVVVGQTVVDHLFSGQSPVGSTLKLNRVTYRVVGVLAPKGSNGFLDQDDIVLAPITAVQDTLLGRRSSNVSLISVQAVSKERIEVASEEVTGVLLQRHKISNPNAADFQVRTQADLISTRTEATRVFTILLAAVAAISLVVGGIGIMNIMLVTVTERTREIGIRKALGARRRDILGQFLVESMLLAGLGGALGVGAGLIGSHHFPALLGRFTPVVQQDSVLLAFGVSVGIGLFFGIYPANRAASLRPIEALRYE